MDKVELKDCAGNPLKKGFYTTMDKGLHYVTTLDDEKFIHNWHSGIKFDKIKALSWDYISWTFEQFPRAPTFILPDITDEEFTKWHHKYRSCNWDPIFTPKWTLANSLTPQDPNQYKQTKITRLAEQIDYFINLCSKT